MPLFPPPGVPSTDLQRPSALNTNERSVHPQPALSSALAAHAKAVLAEDSYELAPKEALSWAISDHPPHSVLGGEGGVACLAALRAALLDFHRAVKSIRYNKGKAAAVQHPEAP